MSRHGRWVEALLAAFAVFVVGWPLTDFVEGRPWVWPLVWMLLLTAAVGSLCRGLRAPRWLVLLAQLLTVLAALSWQAGGGAPAGARPSFAAAAAGLVQEGVTTIQNYPVPAPATPGLVFLVLAGMLLLGVLVDALALTFAAPAIAGVPLLLMGALTASSSGDPLQPQYFLAVAAAWLLLLARQDRSSLRRWTGSGAQASSIDPAAADAGATRRLTSLARAVGAVALALAVLVPGLLPHQPPTALVDGLSRGGATGRVSFVETLDLSADLAERSRAPVIRYRTDATAPPPLRITSTSRYQGGRWLPDEPSKAPRAGGLVDLPGTSLQRWLDDLPTTTATLTVTSNGLRAPQLAIPQLSTGLDVGAVDWTWDPYSAVARVSDRPADYNVTFLQLPPGAELPDDVGDPTSGIPDEVEEWLDQPGGGLELGPGGRITSIVESDGTVHALPPDITLTPQGGVAQDVGPDTLELDPASSDRVTALAREVVGTATNELDVATAIQQYLRGPDFHYSLTLAPPVEGEDGQPQDAISHFLDTRQGYCTQFATAMIMMARAEGIPARMGVGFLPGEHGADGTRTVVAADAHAWPELFITGLGWTRFEPTPGTRSGAAPAYPRPTSTEQPEVADPDPTIDAAPPQLDGSDAAADRATDGAAGWFEQHRAAVARGLAATGAVILLLSVVPLASRWHRRRLRRQQCSADPIDAEWAVLESGLADLGVPPRPELTPRGLRDHYGERLRLDPPPADALGRAAGDALDRATSRVESSRYAVEQPPMGTMAADVQAVLAWRRQSLPRHRRVVVALLPASGRAQLRRLAHRSEPVEDPATVGR